MRIKISEQCIVLSFYVHTLYSRKIHTGQQTTTRRILIKKQIKAEKPTHTSSPISSLTFITPDIIEVKKFRRKTTYLHQTEDWELTYQYPRSGVRYSSNRIDEKEIHLPRSIE